ncbi:hypothetical protein MHYP_G00103700 [Metynnis hypsauchen]
MKILLIFTLFLTPGGGESGTVTGYSGGGVLIKCGYDTGYTSNPKYLCTGLWPFLVNQIWTNGKNEWMNMHRFSLFDDTRAAQFWVVIRELTVKDSGTYYCAVGKFAVDVYTPVKLNVKEGQSHEKSINVSVHVGDVLNISCRYPQFPGFLCWRVGHDDCSHNITVNESNIWTNEGNLFLRDDGKEILTVNISSLTEGDSGEYWCGAEFDWTSDHGYKVYIKQDSLSNIDQTATSSSSPSSTPKTPLTTSFSTVNSSLETTTDIFPLSSANITSATAKPATSSTSKTTASSVSATSSSVRTLLSAILVVLLIGLFVFILIIMLILYLQKKCKTQGPASTQSQPVKDPSHERISLSVYEEIKDIPLPSSSPDQDIYSTAQLPTVLSDSSASATQPSAGISAEGPTYATVNFSSTDAVTTATINKENS